LANISENAQTILEKRYFIDGETKAEQMFRRVAHHISQAEKEENREYWEEQFYNLMNNLDFLPNSPTLMNAGTKIKNFSACFVLNIEDSIESIFDFYKDAALVCKAGGGIGASYSKLRPKDDTVASTQGVASGPISWMKIQDSATEEMKQGGRRRGANMGVLRIDHPSIEEFITCKDDGKSLQNFNLSIAITDEFINAVKNDLDFELKFNGKIYKIVKAKDYWNKICYHAWLRGDPGLFFIDTANKYNPTPHIGKYESVNVCGEQVLLSNEACTLGSINLLNMLKYHKDSWIVDTDKLEKTIKIAVRFLDDVLDCNVYPTKAIEKMAKGNRKIGLGIMGFGDMLYKMNIPYNTSIAIDLASRIMGLIYDITKKTSEQLGDEKGYFPNDKNLRRRNAALTTIAPTGTIAIIADVSSGCEPNFALCYERTAMSMNNQKFYFMNQILKDKLSEINILSDELLQKISNNNGSVQGIKEIPKKVQDIFITAMEISPEWHVKMQAAFQNNGVDSAVSKTCNLPSNATVEDVANIYMLAYELGCKGITIFRDGCRGENQVLSTGFNIQKNNQTEIKQEEQQFIKVKPPLEEAYGKRKKYETGCGDIWLKIFNDDEGNLREIFSQSSGGGCKANIETISRLVSLLLRANVDPEQIIDQLSSAYCKTCHEKTKCRSCGDVIAKQIKKFLVDDIKIIPVRKNENPKITGQLNIPVKIVEKIKETNKGKNVCPECGEKLIAESGCFRCNCGYSKCS
jgi:ribonucleoside-diphosphate reductase alpha chain